ncbi:MAG TPA: hypothetical protein QGF02_01390 [Candidatus Babeliales bacterium]|nr:hypothetical protein [Candidatus Babeliales bacterium]
MHSGESGAKVGLNVLYRQLKTVSFEEVPSDLANGRNDFTIDGVRSPGPLVYCQHYH